MGGQDALDIGELPAEGEPEVSPDGVDLGLIRWMLSLTPG
jgi:hypothetical protein